MPPLASPPLTVVFRRIFRRRLRLFVTVFVGALVLTLAGAYLRPRLYETSFSFQLTEDTKIASLKEMLGFKFDLGHNAMSDEAEVLQSHEVVQRALVRTGIIDDAQPAGLGERDATSWRVNRHTAIERFREAIGVTLQGTILHAKVTIQDADFCRKFATELLRVYQAHALEVRRKAALTQTQFILKERIRLRESIKSQEAILKLCAEREGIETKRVQRVTRAVAIEKEMGDLRDRLVEEHERLLARYTVDHPRMVGLTNQMAFLDALLKATSMEDFKARANAELMGWVQRRQEWLRLRQEQTEVERELSEFDARHQQTLDLDPDSRYLKEQVALDWSNLNTLERTLAQLELSMSGVPSPLAVLQEPDVAVPQRTLSTYRLGILAIVLAGTVAMGAAYLAEYSDPSLVDVKDIEHHVGVKVIGEIPMLENLPGADAKLPTICDIRARSRSADAYRILRTNIMHRMNGRKPLVLLVTSSGPQEGKSTTVLNLGMVFSELGSRTLMIVCNLRRPTLAQALRLAPEPGVAEAVRGEVDWRQAVQVLPVQHLSLLPAGRAREISTSIVNAPAMARIISETRSEFDVVIVDSPPVSLVTDAAILAPLMDGVLFVYAGGGLDKATVRGCAGMLTDAGAHLVGLVVNQKSVDVATQYMQAAYHHHGYHGSSPDATTGNVDNARGGRMGRRRHWCGPRALLQRWTRRFTRIWMSSRSS